MCFHLFVVYLFIFFILFIRLSIQRIIASVLFHRKEILDSLLNGYDAWISPSYDQGQLLYYILLLDVHVHVYDYVTLKR